MTLTSLPEVLGAGKVCPVSAEMVAAVGQVELTLAAAAVVGAGVPSTPALAPPPAPALAAGPLALGLELLQPARPSTATAAPVANSSVLADTGDNERTIRSPFLWK